jgi:hypothetical protein
MKMNQFYPAVCVLCCCLMCPNIYGQGAGATSDKETAAAEEVGKSVETALLTANSTGLGGLTLTKAVLTLETGGSIQGGLKLNFLIFTIDHTQKKGTTINQTITFGALQKPAGGGVADASALKDSLAKAIATAAEVATQVHTLPLSEATVKIQFVVEKKSDGSIAFDILGVKGGPSVNLDNTSTNSLEVTFAKK